MLTYELKKSPGVPLYEALYRCIRGDILSGALAPGQKLPSKRALAQNLSLSKITVESAYKKFLGDTTTYNVAVYVVDENALNGYDKDLESIRGLSKSKAKAIADDGVMTRAADATIVLNTDTGDVVSFEMK